MKSKPSKVEIFIDTNILMCSTDRCLEEFKFNETYYRLVSFIKDNRYDHIKIIIPKIVIEELFYQYIREYDEIFKQLFGENLCKELEKVNEQVHKLGYEVKIKKRLYNNKEEYIHYLIEKYNNFINNQKSNFQILEYSSKQILNNLVKRSLNIDLPFFKGKTNDKDFTDAGFKDAIFLEIIKKYSKNRNSIKYILTKDKYLESVNWRSEINDNKVKVINFDQGIALVDYLCKELKLDDFSEYIKFADDTYFKEKIEKALNCSLKVAFKSIKKKIEEDVTYIHITSLIVDKGKTKKVTIVLDETMGFISCYNPENQEIIFSW
ncbi:MAG: PIN domain-containing protein [Endomicrobiaceae bacterium]|nr:PIN domain-containing protein [Endomicrobiaceae bacterium]MDD3922538.1 PIN domain-containing protein [Endomicrobiaceae bacterium]